MAKDSDRVAVAVLRSCAGAIVVGVVLVVVVVAAAVVVVVSSNLCREVLLNILMTHSADALRVYISLEFTTYLMSMAVGRERIVEF